MRRLIVLFLSHPLTLYVSLASTYLEVIEVLVEDFHKQMHVHRGRHAHVGDFQRPNNLYQGKGGKKLSFECVIHAHMP